MPVSKECIKLLRSLVDKYGQEGKEDRDYSSIHSLLKELLFLVVQNEKKHKDERIISFLSNSALILEENSCFAAACRSFLFTYQKKTHALDSMLDEDLSIQLKLDDSWGQPNEVETSQPFEHSRFFIQLQEAIAKRANRIAKKEKESRNNPLP